MKKYIPKHTGWEKNNVFIIFTLQFIPVCLAKNVLKATSNATFKMKKIGLDESQLTW